MEWARWNGTETQHNEMHDLIFIGMEEWDEVWRRSQNLVTGLSRRDPKRRILFVGLSLDVSHAIRTRQWRTVWRGCRASQPQRVPGLPNVWTFNPRKILPDTLPSGRHANRVSVRSQVRRAARAIGITRPLLWIKPHYAAHMVGHMGERALIYDIGDDWTAFQTDEKARRRAAREDEFLARRADALIVVSEHLAAMKRPLRPDVHLISNGADVARYAQIGQSDMPPHPPAHDWTHPVLGHTGTLHAQRSDIDMILAVARAFPEGTVALVGPSFLEEADTARLKAQPNIRLTGPVDHTLLPRVMNHFDVCIVPHRVTPFTQSQNPLKLYEYLASGLPIVSTPVSGFCDYPELVHVANNGADFIQAIHQALKEPEALREQRRAAAAEHTWDTRVEAVERVFEEVLKVEVLKQEASDSGSQQHAKPELASS